MNAIQLIITMNKISVRSVECIKLREKVVVFNCKDASSPFAIINASIACILYVTVM